uniref:TF-B3 domain-containing protein n=1 Tax=Quercus lobata TaxID=97700 RepID=A0A7N2M9E7_QUELO
MSSKSADYAPSIYITLSTMELNSKYLTSASPINSTNRREYLTPFLTVIYDSTIAITTTFEVLAPNQDPSQAPNQDPSFNATPEILQKQKLGDPSDKVMTGIDCGEDPTASLGSPVCHELPQEKNVKPLVCISPPQKQDSPAHFTEQFSTDSSNEGDTSCETLIDSETSEGDSSGKTCSYSQNLSEESDDEVQEIFRPLNSAVIPLFEKFLTPSDADPKMARLVIPKKSAEAYFPKVTEAHGFPIVFQDTQRKEWEFNLRFWVNCNSKMYVLEGLKEYMTLMQWQAGDKVTFHRIEPEGKFLIATKKIVKPPPKLVK